MATPVDILNPMKRSGFQLQDFSCLWQQDRSNNLTFLSCTRAQKLGGLRKFQQNNLHELGLGRLSIKPKSSQNFARVRLFLESLLLVLDYKQVGGHKFLALTIAQNSSLCIFKGHTGIRI